MPEQRRMLYAKIWGSEQFGLLEPMARLLYIGCITLADDDGRMKANPKFLRGQIFPYDDISVEQVCEWRDQISRLGLVEIYGHGEIEYLSHPKWKTYQYIRSDRYQKSHLPSPLDKGSYPLVTKKLPDGNTIVPKRGLKLNKVKLNKIKLSNRDQNENEDEKKKEPKITYPYPIDRLSIKHRDNAREKNANDNARKLPEITQKSYETLFETFWQAYPRKVAKQKAFASFVKLKPTEEMTATLVAAVERHKKTNQWQRDNGEYIPHPTTWLNQGRWEDEVKEAPPHSSSYV